MRILLFCLIVLTSFSPSAQAEAIYGRVYDTMGEGVLPGARIVLSNPTGQRETIADKDGAYGFKDVKPGAYLVHIYTKDRAVVGRILVYPKLPTTIANLDLGKIDAPGPEDAY